jgi:hypothetical protein
MDPISALALACNITQLVQQAIGVIIACKKLHEEGSLDCNNEIENYAENIAALNEDVKATLQKNTTQPTGMDLFGVAQAASDTAAELKIELNKLKFPKKQGVRGTGLAFKVALRNLYNRRALDQLQKRLEQQDALLQSGLLKRLYADFSLNQSRQQTQYQNLSQGQKDIIAQVLKASESVLTSIDKSVKASEENIVAHFEQNAARQRLLDALAFPEMNERHHMIEDRVSDFALAYKWIFRESFSDSEPDASDSDSDDALGPWNQTQTQHDFVDWLRTGTDPFWISGKPGSGKSTFMACVYQNLQEGRTGHDYLKAWAGIKSIRILSFWFFRPASSHLLKSLQGFLRSLCFQILNGDNSIVVKLRENLDGKAPSSLRSYLTSSGVNAQTWTNSDLKTWLKYLLEHSKFVYCLIVDGLDEVEKPEGREHVLEAIQWLSKCTTVIKICCSSRPESPFKRVLEQYRFLRVQDFNFGDIQKACHQRLANTRAAHFADKIADRAEGVFLWAHMVAEDLRAAADRGDDDTDMKMRLAECPTEMNDLFTLMLERMDRFYMKRPGPYLRLVDLATKAGNSISLLELLLASQDQEDLISRLPGKLGQDFYSQLNNECFSLETNIVARCGGLVEFVRDSDRSYLPEHFPHQNLRLADSSEAIFIHRSAQDFLADNKSAAVLLESCNMSRCEAATRLFAASVVVCLMENIGFQDLKPLSIATLFEAEDWLPAQITLLDVFFTNLQSYQVSDIGLLQRMSSPKLSPLENTIFYQLAMFPLAVYFHTRLQRLSIDQVQDAIAISISERPLKMFRGYCDDFTDVLRQYVKPNKELSLLYKFESYPGFLCTCLLGHHILISCVEWDHENSIWGSSRLACIPEGIPELRCFVDISHARCWMIGHESFGSEFTWIPVPDDTKAAVEILKDSEVWGVCISLDSNSKRQDVKEVLQWSPCGCNYFFDIDDEDNLAFTQHFQAILCGEEDECSGEQPHLGCSMSDLCVAFLNRKLDTLSLQEKVAMAWYSIRVYEGSNVLEYECGIYFEAGQFRPANRDKTRESWEESFYEKSKCQGIEYDAETTEMIKCMLNDDEKYVKKIRRRVQRKRLETVSSAGDDTTREESESD